MPLYETGIEIYWGHSLSKVQLTALPKETSTLSFSSSVNKQGKQTEKQTGQNKSATLCTVTFSLFLFFFTVSRGASSEAERQPS